MQRWQRRHFVEKQRMQLREGELAVSQQLLLDAHNLSCYIAQ